MQCNDYLLSLFLYIVHISRNDVFHDEVQYDLKILRSFNLILISKFTFTLVQYSDII